MRVWWVLALWGCNGKDDAEDTNPPPPPATTTTLCESDEDCGSNEICDDGGYCANGDRDGSGDLAVPITITEQEDAPSGVIEPEGDIDWWVFTAPTAEWIDVRTIADGDLDTVLRVWTEDGTEYAAIDNFATGYASGYDSILRLYLSAPGDWYFTVEDVTTYYTDLFSESDWRGGPDFGYQLWIQEYTAVLDETDSLADPSGAITLEDGSTIFSIGFIVQDTGDSDYATIDLQVAGQPLEVWGQPANYGSPLDLRARLYAPDASLVADLAGVGPEGHLSYYEPVVGTYTVEVTDAAGLGSSDAWGVMYLRTYEADSILPFFGDSVYIAELEPNDDLASATGVAMFLEGDDDFSYDAGHLQGALGPDLDVDFFTFDAEAGDLVSMRCFTSAFGSLAALSVRLYDDAGADSTPIGQGDSLAGGDDYWLLNAPVGATGTWSVSLAPSDGNYGLDAYYRCAVFLSTENVAP
jgi:hypothetical protein